MRPTLSIIVPAYNCGSYLRECVDSILNQKFDDFELILVDDGSTDGTAAICDEYAASFPDKIFAFHKQNGGAASARNLGLDKARGNFIGFIDGDDTIKPEMFMALTSCQREFKVDIVSSGIIDFHNGVESVHQANEAIFCDNRTMMIRSFEWKENVSANTKLFSKELIGKTRFREGVINEDFLFLIEIYLKPSKAYIIPDSFYYYRETPGSVTRVLRPKQFDIFKNLDYLEGKFELLDDELRKKFNTYALTMHIMTGVKIVKTRKNREFKHWLRKHRAFILKNSKELLFTNSLSPRWKIKALATFLRLP